MDNYTYHEGTESEQQRLVDGAYDSSQRHGQPSLTVRMTISEGRVVDKEVIKHFASWKGTKANDIITEGMVAEQPIKVEAVSGGTNRSRVLMNAVQEALEKA